MWKVLFLSCFFVAGTSANGCCRNYKFFQYRPRPNVIPVFEPPPPPCDDVYGEPDHFCENPMDGMYQAEPIKFEPPVPQVNRYFTSYMEPKPIPHKCMCNKAGSSQRLMQNIQSLPNVPAMPSVPSLPNLPRYYKRRCCNDQMMEALSMRHSPRCGQCSCGPFEECGQYCHCGMAPLVFRQPPHQVLPLPIPTSCIC